MGTTAGRDRVDHALEPSHVHTFWWRLKQESQTPVVSLGFETTDQPAEFTVIRTLLFCFSSFDHFLVQLRQFFKDGVKVEWHWAINGKML
ncbi:hypothetical protein AGR9A_Lc80125 [Agrobacterium salinitolerans str. Hayward 0363]|nr:hypothetical protein AGR9A_Lc80125 [Agrobacterium salinitolerans str. Hayward 0363]